MSIQKSNPPSVIHVRLREAMRAYAQRTGERMTYEVLAARLGLSRATVESIGTRKNYNATLKVVARICDTLGCSLSALLELEKRPRKSGKRGAK